MKKSFKTGVCKALTTIACATFMFAGALGLGSITAKAATKKLSVDLSNGKTVGFSEKDLDGVTDPNNIPKGVSDSYAVMFSVLTYDWKFTEKYQDSRHATSVLSNNPYQGILLEQSDGYTVKISALNGSTGTGTYVINKKTIMQNPECTEREALIMLMFLDEVTGGDTNRNIYSQEDLDALGNLEFNVEIKYSDAPIIANNRVNAAPAVSFVPGREFQDNGINYRIMDAAGNLSAISLATASKEVTIPETVKLAGFNLNVTDIAQNFMKGNKKTKKVTIGANVTSIGKEAFYKCKKLKKVTVKSTKIASFGKKAFGKDAKNFKLKMPKSCKKAYKKLLKKAKIKI
ncbi:leucine-rich repeat protein [Butyrivibrio sp. XPD2002]|uniref:leucine-rich repeat protein n=1 Tax=Butyrivibrio sp. XPD2002 TaxID=1280665 RepID=UPI00047A7355|nr:leucine-rich repeat protein [Butyrivibrio sp. XPD2002]